MFSRNAIRVITSRRTVILRQSVSRYNIRFNSTEPEKRVAELMQVISSNSALKLAFEDVSKLMTEKGFDANMGIMQQMKFLMDTDVREGLKKVAGELKKSGVEIKLEDMQSLTKMLNINLKK